MFKLTEMGKDLQVFPKEQDVLPKGLRVTNRNHRRLVQDIANCGTLIENGVEDETRGTGASSVAPVKQERWLCPMLRLINRLMFD